MREPSPGYGDYCPEECARLPLRFCSDDRQRALFRLAGSSAEPSCSRGWQVNSMGLVMVKLLADG